MNNLLKLEKELVKPSKQQDPQILKQNLDEAKQNAEDGIAKQLKMCFFIKKMQGNLVQMIEHIAQREQNNNLEDFLRRESVIPGLYDEEDKEEDFIY